MLAVSLLGCEQKGKDSASNEKAPDDRTVTASLRARDYISGEVLSLRYETVNALMSGDWMKFTTTDTLSEIQEKLTLYNSGSSVLYLTDTFLGIEKDDCLYYAMLQNDVSASDNSGKICCVFAPIASFLTPENKNISIDFYFPYHLIQMENIQYYRAGGDSAYPSELSVKSTAALSEIERFYDQYSPYSSSIIGDVLSVKNGDNIISFSSNDDRGLTIEVR